MDEPIRESEREAGDGRPYIGFIWTVDKFDRSINNNFFTDI